jgi:hypothetical protein
LLEFHRWKATLRILETSGARDGSESAAWLD